MRAEPIALVGMAFRLPGDLAAPEAAWRAFCAGRDLVGVIDPARFATGRYTHPRRSEPGTSVSFAAGTISGIDRFDAGFFNIAPREAAIIDPQQRLLLELAFEAIEDAGLAPHKLAGSDCAVHVGISGFDYSLRAVDDLAALAPHSMTGNTLSLAANRISWAFDLHGPSMAVDTACSSALVALHQACVALRAGEASLALTGGVNLLLHPLPFIGFTKAGMLSASGRCRSFDAAGDGYVRAEGGAIFVLKPLRAAEAAGDRIHAVILATGVNADGARKTGLTIPSVAGQEDLLRRVLDRAGIGAAEIDYLEAHGTGTAVGDPVEATAIGHVYGQARPGGHRLPIGSVKSNLGHLEAAAGAAGLVKTVLALRHGAVPPNLHFRTPNPRIDFDALNLDVVTAPRLLPRRDGRPLTAGINAFGFGGANAHALLRAWRPATAAPRAARQAAAPPPSPVTVSPATARPAAPSPAALPPPLLLSAADAAALAARAGALAALLAGPDAPTLAALVHDAAHRRQRLGQRLALRVADTPAAIAALQAVAAGDTPRGALRETALRPPGRLAFVYSGNGAQFVGMGRTLAREHPGFAAELAALDASFSRRAGFSLAAALAAEGPESRLDDTTVAQPLLFLLQVALTRQLAAAGIVPGAVMGHSVGEIAAAWAAGCLDLDQAFDLVLARSAAQGPTRGAGRMAAVALGADALAPLLAEPGFAALEIAALNAPDQTTLAGPHAALDALGARLAAARIAWRLLDLDYAFHSRAMDAARPLLEARLADLAPRAGTLPFVSTVTGAPIAGAALDAAYWGRNLRETVRFADAAAALAAQGCRVFLEIGPHAILGRYLRDTLAARAAQPCRVLPGLAKGQDGAARLDEIVLRAHLLADDDAAAAQRARLFPAAPPPEAPVAWPAYPWQRERHWQPNTPEGYRLIETGRDHALLGWRLKNAPATWENILDPALLPWLADHRVGGAVVFPAAGHVELALAAARALHDGARLECEALEILAPLVFAPEESRALRFALTPDDGRFAISSRPRRGDAPWTLHAVGRLLDQSASRAAPPDAPVPPLDGPAESVDIAALYQDAATRGLEYGPAFRSLAALRRVGGHVEASLAAPAALADAGEATGAAAILLHPVLLDGAFQALLGHRAAADAAAAGDGVALLPVAIGAVRRYGAPRPPAFLVARLLPGAAREAEADIVLLDQDRRPLAELDGVRLRPAPLAPRADAAAASPPPPALWRLVPVPRPHPRGPDDAPMHPDSEALLAPVSAWFRAEESELRRDAVYQIGHKLVVNAFALEAVRGFARARAEDRAAIDGWLDDPSTLPPARAGWFCFLRDLAIATDGLEKTRTGWRIAPDFVRTTENDVWRMGLGVAPEFGAEWTLASQMHAWLPDLLLGRADPRAALQALRGSAAMEAMLWDSPLHTGLRLALGRILAGIAQGWPRDRRLAVLEICAAGGGLRRPDLAAQLPLDRLDYVIAATDPDSLARLTGADAGAIPAIPALIAPGLGALTPQDPAAAPLPPRFDVVVLSHALSATADLDAAIAGLDALLVPGGRFVLVERHPDTELDMIFGLDPAWWRFGTTPDDPEDSLDVRRARRMAKPGAAPRSRLRSPRGLALRLDAAGFEDLGRIYEPGALLPSTGEPVERGVYLLTGTKPQQLSPRQALMVAQFAGVPREQWPPDPGPEPHDRADPGVPRFAWLMLADGPALPQSCDLGAELAAALMRDGHQAQFRRDIAAADPPAAALAAASAALGRVEQLVWLPGPIAALDRPDSAAATDAALARALALVQALLRADTRIRLWVVTQGASLDPGAPADPNAPEPPPVDPGAAALWGFFRVAMAEHPGLDCTLIDLADDIDHPEIFPGLLRECRFPDGEREIRLRAESRVALRLLPERPPARPSTRPNETAGFAAATAPAPRFRLVQRSPGRLASLAWETAPALPPPGPGEVEVAVHAAGLNFRDVMQGLGLLPDAALERGLAGIAPGLDFAGRVLRVGAGVDEALVDRRVYGLGRACFASHVVTSARLVQTLPEPWSFAAGAAIPTAAVTAWHALQGLARVAPGEIVLIHGAAGAVGTLAVQIARAAEARVFATAGSPEKHDLLRMLGAERVCDSRSLDFVDAIRAATDGDGVDVVVNSLAGEAMRRSLGLLRPGGRFIELGKRDYVENTRIGLRALRDNVAYFGLDIDQLARIRPEAVEAALAETQLRFLGGALQPPPTRLLPAARAVEGFRLMQQGRHIGKIVFDLATTPPLAATDAAAAARRAPPAAPPATAAAPLPDAGLGAWLVAGGLAGFGAAIAAHLAAQGVRRLVLIGRRGADTPGAAALLARLAALGAETRVLACDIADPAALAAALATLPRPDKALKPAERDQTGWRITAVIHAAVGYADAALATLDPAKLAAATRAKLAGAWALHHAFAARRLRHFVLISSATTLFGNPGQAGYVAANAALEALAEARRRAGRAGLALGFGPIAGTGALAAAPDLAAALAARLGGAPLDPDRALAALDQALRAPRTQPFASGASLVALDPAALAAALPAGQIPPRFAAIVAAASRAAAPADAEGAALAAALAAGDGAALEAALTAAILAEVAATLGVPAERLDPARPLPELGLDSLMGVELALALERRLGAKIPMLALGEGPSIARLAAQLARQLRPAPAESAAEAPLADDLAATAAALARQHEAGLAPAQLAAILAAARAP